MATLKDSYTTTDDAESSVRRSSGGRGFTFLATATYTLTSVKLKVWRAGTIGTVNVQIRDVNQGTKKPTGAVLGTVAIDVSAVTTVSPGELITATIGEEPTITSGIYYAVTVEPTIADWGFGNLLWIRDHNGVMVTQEIYESLDTWNTVGFPWDTIYFEIYGDAVLPSKATTPAPANTATDVTLDQATITWVNGGNTDTYDVYYGTSAAAVAAADTTDETGIYIGNQAGTSLTVTGITSGSPYAYLTSRYWRIDSVNAGGTTTGDAWSFTTLRFSPPTVTYFYSAIGQYYQLLIQEDGTYGDPPPIGVEDTDYVYLAAGYVPNFIKTTRKLVGVANSKVWVEDI